MFENNIVINYLEKYSDLLLEEKINLQAQQKNIEQEIKETVAFRKLLEEKNDSSFEDNDTFGSETNEKTVCYKVTNISGKSASKCVTAKVDTVKPTCSANIAGGIVGNNGWYKGTPAPNVKFSATDNLSGMSDNYENDNKKLIVTEGKNKIYQN